MESFEFEVTTSIKNCQELISYGALCLYGFQHEEAFLTFQKASSLDPSCAMAHYLIACCQAANYNNPNGIDYSAGYKESQIALDLAQKSSKIADWETALIEAQAKRFCWPVSSKPLPELNRDYANAMRTVYEKYGQEFVDVAVLFAESLMLLAPWQMWTKPPSIKPANPETEEAATVLEAALETNSRHPGAAHFYIHLMELSSTPEKALPAANMLRRQFPDQGHLLHMAGHIDMWVGHYKAAIDTNINAVAADKRYKEKTGRDNELYKSYRMHNYHSAVWAAMFDGQFDTAIEYAEAAEKQIDAEAVAFKFRGFPVGTVSLESYAVLPWHVLVRFGKWEAIIARPIKSEAGVFTGTIATSHYARAVAFSVLGKLNEADEERKKFYSTLKSEALKGRRRHNNVMHDPDNHSGILDVAEEVMNGEVEYHKGNYEKAFKHLRVAVERDCNLAYDEPWGWMVPARHALGALLLEHGEAEEAEAVYREDLKQYKDNLWSLLGLYQALKQQKKMEEAESVNARFKKASTRADISIGASCLCATKMIAK